MKRSWDRAKIREIAATASGVYAFAGTMLNLAAPSPWGISATHDGPSLWLPVFLIFCMLTIALPWFHTGTGTKALLCIGNALLAVWLCDSVALLLDRSPPVITRRPVIDKRMKVNRKYPFLRRYEIVVPDFAFVDVQHPTMEVPPSTYDAVHVNGTILIINGEGWQRAMAESELDQVPRSVLDYDEQQRAWAKREADRSAARAKARGPDLLLGQPFVVFGEGDEPDAAAHLAKLERCVHTSLLLVQEVGLRGVGPAHVARRFDKVEDANAWMKSVRRCEKKIEVRTMIAAP